MFSQEIQPIVAEEHLSIGDECRRTEDAAIARLTARLRERHVARFIVDVRENIRQTQSGGVEGAPEVIDGAERCSCGPERCEDGTDRVSWASPMSSATRTARSRRLASIGILPLPGLVSENCAAIR
jgi:hypothetical protein